MTEKMVSNQVTNMVTREELEDSGLFQPQVFKRVDLKHGFKKETIWYPFVCPQVFMTKEDAGIYLPFYIKDLINRGDLEKSVLKEEDGKKYVDEDQVRTCIVKLSLSAMEQIS